jgi:hypothetical protein
MSNITGSYYPVSESVLVGLGSHHVTGSAMFIKSDIVDIQLSTKTTGSVLISGSNHITTGSLSVSGSVNSDRFSGSFSGSFQGDGAYRVANSSNNRILTSVDARNGNAEANLTFDGTELSVTGKVTATTITGSLSGSLVQGTSGSFTQITGSLSGSLIQGTSASFSDITTTTLTETSAERFKTNIQTLDLQLDKVNLLNPVTFDWIDNGNEDIGLIAEQVNEVYPEFVSRNPDGEIQGIKYSKLTAVLIKSIQELKQEVETLKAKIDG